MPRSKTILQNEFPYHVSGRCINKEWFKIPIQDVWNIMSDELVFINYTLNAQIHSFVLMNNHFHLLISTPDSNLDKIMARFMKQCSRHINEISGRINQAYGARHFRSVIESDFYFHQVYKYVYRNPVKAELVEKCELYPFSSLNFLLGDSKASFPIVEDHILFTDVEKTLGWLNTKTSIEDWNSVSKALRKARFRFAKSDILKRPNSLEYRLI